MSRYGGKLSGKGAPWGGVFVLGSCARDNMPDNPDNHISPPHMAGFGGTQTRPAYEGEMSFDLEDNLNH